MEVGTGRGQVGLHQLRDDLRGVLAGLALHLHGHLLQRARLAARHQLRQLRRVDRQHVLTNETLHFLLLLHFYVGSLQNSSFSSTFCCLF